MSDEASSFASSESDDLVKETEDVDGSSTRSTTSSSPSVVESISWGLSLSRPEGRIDIAASQSARERLTLYQAVDAPVESVHRVCIQISSN